MGKRLWKRSKRDVYKRQILEWADETKSFVVFGEEDQTYGRFETDIFVEENAYFELGIFLSLIHIYREYPGTHSGFLLLIWRTEPAAGE